MYDIVIHVTHYWINKSDIRPTFYLFQIYKNSTIPSKIAKTAKKEYYSCSEDKKMP